MAATKLVWVDAIWFIIVVAIATMAISQLADNSATPLPTERILVAQNENRRLESRLFRIGYFADNWSASLNAFPGALRTFASKMQRHPCCYIYLKTANLKIHFWGWLLTNKKPLRLQRSLHFTWVGLPGFEPRMTGPESVVLPLHHSPMLFCECKSMIYFLF